MFLFFISAYRHAISIVLSAIRVFECRYRSLHLKFDRSSPTPKHARGSVLISEWNKMRKNGNYEGGRFCDNHTRNNSHRQVPIISATRFRYFPCHIPSSIFCSLWKYLLPSFFLIFTYFPLSFTLNDVPSETHTIVLVSPYLSFPEKSLPRPRRYFI